MLPFMKTFAIEFLRNYPDSPLSEEDIMEAQQAVDQFTTVAEFTQALWEIGEKFKSQMADHYNEREEMSKEERFMNELMGLLQKEFPDKPT